MRHVILAFIVRAWDGMNLSNLSPAPAETALAAYALGTRVQYLSKRDAGNPRQLDADVDVRRLIKYLQPLLQNDEHAATPSAIALTPMCHAILRSLAMFRIVCCR